jgi:rhamnose utilization protein RhaD (predicted bifunctional aldolase and dehydrogenase)/NAD(P)-dependent dehydrogenase (short-subunit alcohol dehydrogenase family)
MQSSWRDNDAARFGADPLGQRVYSSRLLGREPSLVLHGGGNTSLKATGPDPLGEPTDLLYVKGSGWDLASIDRAGFAPVRMSVLERLADREFISDADLVRVQRTALTDPAAPDPSVEAVLHAIIPFAFVDHTHADAVVALTNTPNGDEQVRTVFGDRLLVVPYVMPGFALARRVFEMTREVDWSALDGMILLNHGVFTWGGTARDSYESMIRLVTLAEEFLAAHGALDRIARDESLAGEDLPALSRIRRAVSAAAGRPMVALGNRSPEARGFAALRDVAAVATRGPLTPDHVIRTKRVPVVFGGDPSEDVESFATSYREYFERCNDGAKRMLDVAPRWAVWPGHGTLAFGATPKQASIVADITEHTIAAIQWAEALGGWRALPESDLFDVEYWDLEQAKLAKGGAGRPFDGRVALVTGAASGIGKAVAAELVAQGAAVVTVDVAAGTGEGSASGQRVDIVADVTDPDAARHAVESAVRHFGGLDVLVSNVGILPDSRRIDALDDDTWQRALDVNLTSHQRMLTAAAPYLARGLEPAVVIVGSKNVPAPGPGQAAYSVSKAGLTQLARVAALELAREGIRVNVVHPNAVFDTAIWTDQMLADRAFAYGLSVPDYKRSNLLGAEVTSAKVASVIVALAGPTFSCTTGAQIPIDGGNERVV